MVFAHREDIYGSHWPYTLSIVAEGSGGIVREETSVGGKASVDFRGREGYQGLPSENQPRSDMAGGGVRR